MSKKRVRWVDAETVEQARSMTSWGVRFDEATNTGRVVPPPITAPKKAVTPAAKLIEALGSLPLPHSFGVACKALRQMIRDKRKAGAAVDDELRQLHHWAAIASFCLPYSKRLGQPGFNIMCLTPYAKLKALDLSWKRIGGEQLGLLGKQDLALMTKTWGTPRQHTTANAVGQALWREMEDRAIQINSAEQTKRHEEIDDLLTDIQVLRTATPWQRLMSRLFSR